MADMGRLQVDFARARPNAAERRQLLARMHEVTANVPCPHNESHILSFMIEFLKLPADMEGVIVEAGCFKGGSTAKFSHAASLINRKLVVFDSFEGIPSNNEEHTTSILGHSITGWFEEGSFAGRLDEVRSNIERFGVIDVCEFVPGWFEDTMPTFDRRICAAYIDVDLASSTQACMKYLYPLLAPGGIMMSQDGDFPLVIEALKDDQFWADEVGWPRPPMAGIGTSKIVTITKPRDAKPLSAAARVGHLES
jgi:O-methyltransferase